MHFKIVIQNIYVSADFAYCSSHHFTITVFRHDGNFTVTILKNYMTALLPIFNITKIF